MKKDSYTFKKRVNGKFEAWLHGEFVCHTKFQDEQAVDTKLKEMGYDSRRDFLNHRHSKYD